jgi:hypothetical protein
MFFSVPPSFAVLSQYYFQRFAGSVFVRPFWDQPSSNYDSYMERMVVSASAAWTTHI